jgi:DNA-binding LytR/AlgR family response regulator
MRILVCDADEHFAKRCQAELLALAEKHRVQATVDTVSSGERLLFYQDTKYADIDLIYMDYGSAQRSGIQTAWKLRKGGLNADIVIYGADASHAIEAYDVDALHYLVKDQVGSTKFEEVFLKAVRSYNRRRDEVISFSHGGERRTLPIRDILYFEVENRTVTVHYLQDQHTERFAFNSSLGEIAERLKGKGFIRNHSSYLAAEQHIRKRTAEQIEMSNGDQLPIGKSYQKKHRN